uniref:Uncharacterized protein n=1 Tax=Picea sitchensis TaxID=3332 RepID=A9NY35_PICSI|nr:unknown [Picea sitchensis]
MVVISFYRGNLHKVPDTTRRWPIPKPSISLRNYKPKAWAIMAAPRKKTSALPIPKSAKKISGKESNNALITTRKSNALRPQQITSQMYCDDSVVPEGPRIDPDPRIQALCKRRSFQRLLSPFKR